jgi:hypothetical protein
MMLLVEHFYLIGSVIWRTGLMVAGGVKGSHPVVIKSNFARGVSQQFFYQLSIIISEFEFSHYMFDEVSPSKNLVPGLRRIKCKQDCVRSRRIQQNN